MRMDSAMNEPLLAVDIPTFLNPKRYGLFEAIAAILLIGRTIHFVGTCCLDSHKGASRRAATIVVGIRHSGSGVRRDTSMS